MNSFRLTKLAEEDFDQIGIYSLQEWGLDQASEYLAKLDETFIRLAETRYMDRIRNKLRPDLLSCACNKHMIFFRRDANDNVEILRILHQSMDFEQHL